MNNNKYYVIKSLSMMNHLVRCGNDVVKVSINDNAPNFYVFLFFDSPKLQLDMSNFKKN